jgi:hypothetical protein
MIYRRQEGFRVDFLQPIHGSFTIEKVNDQAIHSKEGALIIHDLSLHGAKFSSPLFIPIEERNFEITIHFSLNQKELHILGTFAWEKEIQHHHFYGMNFNEDGYYEHELFEELKEYVQRNRESFT